MDEGQRQLRILCDPCSLQSGTPQVIEIDSLQEEARCPRCGRHYGLLSRRLAAANPERLADGRVRYRFVTEEGAGRRRPRQFEAQGTIKIRAGMFVTLVSFGPRLVGLADQDSGVWYAVRPQPGNHPRSYRLLAFLSWVCLALVALQLLRLVPQGGELFGRYGSGAFEALGLLVALALVPALLWATRTALGPEGPRRRAIPRFRSDEVE
jgi:hypothetical protein